MAHLKMTGRPALTPLWTDYQNSQSSLPTLRTAQTPLLSPSPLSPKTLPSPMYPISHEGLMQMEDRALVDSLTNSIKSTSLSSPKSARSPHGRSPLVSKLEEASRHLTRPLRTRARISKLKSPIVTIGGPGMTQSYGQGGSEGTHRDERNADAFVIARSLRRQSSSPAGNSTGAETPKPKRPDHLTLRAIIRPRAPGRQTFLIQRTLDINELRAKASAQSPETPQSASPAIAIRKPLPVLSKLASNAKQPGAGPQSPKTTSPTADYEKSIRDPKAVPITLDPVVTSLPGLGMLLMSGHVQRGDIIYLPVPHAEAWPQTIRYLYNGQCELTEAMRQNILYLGGSV
ncbi:hypothetical protein GGS20DRAFT_274607 [Poronia punctata]|nr:hypothetical protein GGS20DRAFT_274607 [Poronia punctata]